MSDANLKIKIALDAQTQKLDDIQKQLTALGVSARMAGQSVEKISVSLATMGTAFAASKVVDGLAAVGDKAIEALGSVDEFKHKMAEVSTLSDATAEQIKKLSVGVANLNIPFSNLQIGEALYQAQSAGVEFGKSLQFVEKSSKLAVAGNADLKASTDLLTNVMNSYSLSADQAGRVSDAAMAAVKGGKTTIREMGSEVGKMAAGFASAGISIEDMFAMLATVTSGGIGTAETITYLSAAVAGITKPSDEAKKAAKALGIEFNFQGLQAKGAIGFFKDLSEKTKEYSNQAEIISALFGAEASRGVNQMLRGNAEALEKMAEAQRKNSGATDEAAGKMNTAVNAGLKLEKALSGIAFALKDGFDHSETIDAIAEALSNGEKVVLGVSSAFSVAAAGAGTFGAALMTLKAAETAKDLMSASNATRYVSNGMGGMTLATNAATAATGRLSAALNLLKAHPVILALSALTAAGVWVSYNIDKMDAQYAKWDKEEKERQVAALAGPGKKEALQSQIDAYVRMVQSGNQKASASYKPIFDAAIGEYNKITGYAQKTSKTTKATFDLEGLKKTDEDLKKKDRVRKKTRRRVEPRKTKARKRERRGAKRRTRKTVYRA